MTAKKAFWYYFVDPVFPARCVVCGRGVSNASHGVCAECLRAVERCVGENILPDDRKWYLDKSVSVAEYAGSMKELLHQFKFCGRRRLYRPLSRLAAQAVGAEYPDFDIVTSVPMNRGKQYKRGYNQSELIAREMAHAFGKPYRRLLREERSARTQRTLDRRMRYINTLGRYAPAGGRIAGRAVLLVDDVYTTGATLNECARVLKSSGVTRVFALTMARVSPLADTTHAVQHQVVKQAYGEGR